MLDGPSESDRLDCVSRIHDRCEVRCLKVARWFKIEDLAMATIISEQNQLVQFEDVSTQRLRKETQQLLRLVNGCGKYFSFLALVYLFQTIVSYFQLNHDSFKDLVSSRVGPNDYHIEMYGLVQTVCLINIVHALTLLSLAFFIVLFTRKFKILNESHYKQLGALAFLLTAIYLLPVIIVSYCTYANARDSETAAHKGTVARFIDLLVYIVIKSDQGIGGFVLAVIIHFQLYLLIIVMLWCALSISDILDKMNDLKAKNSGTYKGLELNGSEVAIQKQPVVAVQEEATPNELMEEANNIDTQAPAMTLEEDHQSIVGEEQEQQIMGDLL